jgi:sulfatase maturation enzyme AslB (radical SAM superfamily)
MSLATAQAALEAALGAANSPHYVTLSGGEPFLARSLVRRVVSSIRKRDSGSDPIECTILTNGTLVNEDDLDFLVAHDVELQVSFDGGGSAAEPRGAGTNETVLHRLSAALERQPDWARTRLAVGMVVHTATLPSLAESVERLMAEGVSHIRAAPLLTHDPGWGETSFDQLEAQLARLVTTSVSRWRTTRQVPLELLRRSRRASDAPRETPGAPCRVASPQSFTVDPDGRAWGCPALAASLQTLPGLGRVASERLALGHVGDPGFRRRLERLPLVAGSLPLLANRTARWSSHGRCDSCEFSEQCSVCPAATVHIPGVLDPNRVPDHQCGFQRAVIAARQRFQDRVEGPTWLSRPATWPRTTTKS